LEKYDVVIIGGGILGTTISYWISALYDLKICVIEKEEDVAMHTSSRNTGLVHSPLHLDPIEKKVFARCAYLGHDWWKILAKKRNLPWKEVGKLEVALDEKQHKTLEKFLKWGIENGMSENDLEVMDSKQVSEKEPNVKCHSAIFSKRDVSTDYSILTKQVKKESQKNGTKFLFNQKVKNIEENSDVKLTFADNSTLTSKFMINCAASYSLDIAKQLGLAKKYSHMFFRGEYWVGKDQLADLVKTNIYSVPTNPQFPFLNPHLVKRANGEIQVGPNAALVGGPETYKGSIGDFPSEMSGFFEIMTSSSRKVFLNRDFLSLLKKEWLSSISKTAMIDRVKKFIPSISSEQFSRRGISGIRSQIITPEGTFLPDVMELNGNHSFHIINYNSPGATGSSVYSALVVKKLQDSGFLDFTQKPKDTIWNFEDAIHH
jgi:L-2-hydroxyglutarate oxidase